MTINIGSGITIENGISIGGSAGPVSPTLLLELNAADYSGSGSTWPANVGPNATLFNNPGWNAGTPSAFQFNISRTTTEYATVPNLGTLNTWTVESWFLISGLNLNGLITYVVGNEFDLTSSINFGIGTLNAPINYNLSVGLYEGGWETTTGHLNNAGLYQYNVGTFDGTVIKQYYNGGLIYTHNYSGPTNTGGEVRIARRWDSSDTDPANFFPGFISVVRIYNGARTAGDILSTFNAEKANYGL